MPDSTPAVTLKDIARALGVDVSTVSRALREDPRVKPATRERVQRLAETLGYQRDPMLAALSDYRKNKARRPNHQGTFAWVTTHPPEIGWRSIFTNVLLFEKIQRTAANEGYTLEEFSLVGHRMPAKRLAEILSARGIRGLILPSQNDTHARLDLPWENFAAISVSSSIVAPRLHAVLADRFQDAILAVEKLHERGFRRIGLALQDRFHEGSQGYVRSGFECATQRLLGASGPVLIDAWEKLASDAVAWARRHRLDAVITPRLEVVERILAHWGKLFPSRRGLFLYEFHEPIPHPHVLCLVTDLDLIAKTAVRRLIREVQGGHFGLPESPTNSLIAGTLRESKPLR